MGWYTSNLDDSFQWKYGDVAALANAARVGQLSLYPRITALGEDDECFDGEEFLGPIQKWVLKKKLPWKNPIAFDPRSAGGEAVRVDCGVDVTKTLEKWARTLSANRASLIAAIHHFNDVAPGDAVPIPRLSVSTEAGWKVGKREYGALLRWLNAPLAKKKDGPRFTLEGLRAGTLDEFEEYEPDAATETALAALPDGDGNRVFAAHALGFALSTGKALELIQPDDSYEVEVWDTGEDED